MAYRPPTSPIQKERERGRLRKKNRPQPQGVFELSPVESGFSSGLAALHEVDRPQTPSRDSIHCGNQSRPRTPSSNSHGSLPTPSGAKSALLSHIGSVKKRGVRRKRVSTTQQEGVNGTLSSFQFSFQTDRKTSGAQDDPSNPGRPASSLFLTSLKHVLLPPWPISPRYANHTGGWFFRSSGVFSPSAASSLAFVKPSSAHVEFRASTSNSTTNLSLRRRSHHGGSRLSVEKPFGGRDSAPSSSRNEGEPLAMEAVNRYPGNSLKVVKEEEFGLYAVKADAVRYRKRRCASCIG